MVDPPDAALFVELIGITNRCYRCRKQGMVLAGVLVDPVVAQALVDVADDLFIDFEPVGEALRDALDPVWLREHLVGPLKVRTSRQRPEGYISNGCHACDAMVGSYPLREAVERIGFNRLPDFVIRQVLLPLDAVREAVKDKAMVKSEW